MIDDERYRALEALAREGLACSQKALTLLEERGPKREAFERETKATLATIERNYTLQENRLSVLETLIKGTASTPGAVLKAFSQDPVMLLLFVIVMNAFGINPLDLLK